MQSLTHGEHNKEVCRNNQGAQQETESYTIIFNKIKQKNNQRNVTKLHEEKLEVVENPNFEERRIRLGRF